jgi:hypothetical protein
MLDLRPGNGASIGQRQRLACRHFGMLPFQRLLQGLSQTDAGEKYSAAVGPNWETLPWLNSRRLKL